MAGCVLTPEHQLREDSHRRDASPRLYDLPWLVLLLNEADADRALKALRGYYRRGGRGGSSPSVRGIAATKLAGELRTRGRDEDAAEIAGLLHGHALRSVEAGGDLPAHEVNYEQSMVAPLLEILCVARELSGDERELDESDSGAAAMAAGVRRPQPHVRLRDIAIRHWDGYWFGRERLRVTAFPAPLECADGERAADVLAAAKQALGL